MKDRSTLKVTITPLEDDYPGTITNNFGPIKPLVKIICEEKNVSDAIKKDHLYKWVPATPVFISAQTGSGKNTFVEENLFKDVADHGGKILILSNRLALGRQAKLKIAEISDEIEKRKSGRRMYKNEVEKRSDAVEWLDKMFDFGQIHVVSYQSFNSLKDGLADRYDYVIFDECHFFLADSPFNKYTCNILKSILEKYLKAIRVYMSATIDEVINPILAEEIVFRRNYVLNLENVQPYIGKTRGIHQGLTWPYLNLISDYNEYCEYILLNRYKTDTDDYVPKNEEVHENDVYETFETFNAKEAVIYELARDYDYVECKYVKLKKGESDSKVNKYSDFLDLIKDQIEKDLDKEKAVDKMEKWLIFVSDKALGKAMVSKIGKKYASFIDAKSKNKNDEYRSVVTKNSFDKKVLISTSVLDNGVNIFDKSLKNIAIFVFDKVSFMQMLGRKRIEDGKKINLYIQEYSSTYLNYKLQMTRAKLKRIAHAIENPDEVLQEIIDADDIFFLNSEMYKNIKSEGALNCNEFLKRKLICDAKLLERVLGDCENINFFYEDEDDEEDDDNENIRGNESTDEKSKIELGQKTILEQLSWLGKSNEFDVKKYIIPGKTDEDKKREEDEFLEFLESTVVKKEIPEKGKEKKEFFRMHGMNKEKQATFCKEFKEKCGQSSSDMGKSLINKFFEAKGYDYNVISEPTNVDGTYWLLVSSKSQ